MFKPKNSIVLLWFGFIKNVYNFGKMSYVVDHFHAGDDVFG